MSSNNQDNGPDMKTVKIFPELHELMQKEADKRGIKFYMFVDDLLRCELRRRKMLAVEVEEN